MFQTGTPSTQIDQPPNMMIWLKRSVFEDGIGGWVMERLTIKTSGYSQEVRFKKASLASEKLESDLWVFLQSYLPPNTEKFVLTARDTVFQTEAVLLNGLEVTGHSVTNGVQRVLLKFRYILGSAKAVFLPHKAPDLLEELKCNLSMRTLNDVVLPALNLAAIDPIDHFTEAGRKIEAFVERLKQNKHDIEFYSILLSRFLASHEIETPRTLGSAEAEFTLSG